MKKKNNEYTHLQFGMLSGSPCQHLSREAISLIHQCSANDERINHGVPSMHLSDTNN
jgi:hypothetical protein